MQPIELVWAHVKNFVGRQTDVDTNVESLQRLVHLGFYGDAAANHQACDADLCGRLIKHCHKWLQAFIDNDDDCNGKLPNISIDGEPVGDIYDDEEEAEASEDESEEEEEEEEED